MTMYFFFFLRLYIKTYRFVLVQPGFEGKEEVQRWRLDSAGQLK